MAPTPHVQGSATASIPSTPGAIRWSVWSRRRGTTGCARGPPAGRSGDRTPCWPADVAAGADEHRRSTAIIYGELGFAPALARGLFVLSRSVGILAHAWEEAGQARRLKGPMPPSILPTYAPMPLACIVVPERRRLIGRG